jgi:hypothetical protein
MEQQELFEKIAPYLPYNLDIMFSGKKGKLFDRFVITGRVIKFKFKPILRPLSDLKERDFRNECFELGYDDIFNFNNLWLIVRKKQYTLLPQGIYLWLIKNHFDVFGLIESGEAIDINTLKDE